MCDSIIIINSSTDSFTSNGSSNIIQSSIINLEIKNLPSDASNSNMNENKREHTLSLSETKFNAISEWIENVNIEAEQMACGEQETLLKNNQIFNEIKQVDNKQILECYQFEQLLQSLPISENKMTYNLQSNSSNLKNIGDDIDCNSINSTASSLSNGTNSDSCISGEHILDEIYGEQWRNSKNAVFPKSEPRKENQINFNDKRNIKTEVKLKRDQGSLSEKKSTKNYGNGKETSELPWLKKLEKICDSDTSDEILNNITKKYTRKVRTRLFSSDDAKDTVKPSKKDFSIYNSDKDNFNNYSDTDESFKKRLRKNLELTSLHKAEDLLNKEKESAKYNAEKLINNKTGNKQNVDDLNKIENTNNKKLSKNCKPKTKTNIEKNPVYSRNSSNSSNSIKAVASGSSTCESFLSSLSGSVKLSHCHPSARLFRNNFKKYKTELTSRLFKLYNENIFNNEIPDDTPLQWNDKMIKTAGYCYCDEITRRTGTIERKVRIVLSTKVLDAADRLRDTLVHEMCHAATWIVNQVVNGHGNHWKKWTERAREVFPELPPIKECHDYVINTKYTYKCTSCGYCIGRHSKSINVEHSCCGCCHGKFEILINKTNKDGSTKTVLVTPKRTPTAFALFVKENYAEVRTPQLTHGRVMKLLGEKFFEVKIASGTC